MQLKLPQYPVYYENFKKIVKVDCEESCKKMNFYHLSLLFGHSVDLLYNNASDFLNHLPGSIRCMLMTTCSFDYFYAMG